MRTLVAKASLVIVMLCVSASPRAAWAQASSSPVAPTLIPVSGQLLKPDGSPRSGETVSLLISLYNTQTDPLPRWVEQQTVALDAAGFYTVQFGATLPDGLPVDLFSTEGGARWLGVTVQDPGGNVDQPRVMLVSVPYAAKAATAETLGGRAPSDFVLSSTFREDLRTALEEERGSGVGDVTAAAVTLNYLQKGSGSGTGTTDSVVFESDAGNVGVGTNTPSNPLEVSREVTGFYNGGADVGVVARLSNPVGNVHGRGVGLRFSNAGQSAGVWGLVTNASGYGDFRVSTYNGGAGLIDAFVLSSAGNIGVGTTSPAHKVDVRGQGTATVESMFGIYNPLAATTAFNGGAAMRLGWSPTHYYSTIATVFEGQNPDYLRPSLAFFTMGDSATVSTERMRISSSGNVGIGTAAPTAKLHVVGNVAVTGDLIAAGVLGAKYQDVAEWVDSDEALEPGTVVIIDIDEHNHVKASTKANDTRVAGAVSPQPGLILGEAGEGRVLVAQSGRVRIKADARNGAIKPGDLLVTAPRPGYAMKAKSPKPGTVLGKALEPLEKGTGEILVLLTLQ